MFRGPRLDLELTAFDQIVIAPQITRSGAAGRSIWLFPTGGLSEEGVVTGTGRVAVR